MAVSQLTLLTEMYVEPSGPDRLFLPPLFQRGGPLLPADAFTALTASSNLCSLRVDWCHMLSDNLPGDWNLFKAGTVYPQLRLLDVKCTVVSEQHIATMCSCCPALESLTYTADPAAALLHVWQLSALTHLDVDIAKKAGPFVFVGPLQVAAGLKRLKRLKLTGLSELTAATLKPLTALTALEQLDLNTPARHHLMRCVGFCSMPASFVVTRRSARQQLQRVVLNHGVYREGPAC
jgi:hypothetical protein